MMVGTDAECLTCNDAVGVGSGCAVGMCCTPNAAASDDGICLGCDEGFFVDGGECSECGGARRCVDKATHILCADDALLSGATCRAGFPPDALLATGNHVVKCGAGHFARPETCGACRDGCAACRDGASCDICDGTSHRSDTTCAATAGATVETHNGVVACGDGRFLNGDGD